MKKITYLLSTLLIVSCTDNGLIDTEQLENIQPSTRAVGDGKYDALGYGYNCFYADFSDPLYVQGKVIDIERLEEGRGRDQITKDELSFTPAKINEAILHGRAQSRIAYGTSIDKLTKKLNVNVKTKIGTKILKVFSLDLEATINQNSTSNNLNSFYKVDALKTTRRLTLPYTSPSRLKYFLSDEFLADLKELSGQEIIQKYGTHVMTDILLGGNFSAFYTGKYESTDQFNEQEFKAKSNFLLSSVKAGTKYDRTLFKSFKQVNVYIKTQGGTVNSSAIISQSPDGVLDNVSIDYTGWINSVSQNSESLIGIGNPDSQMYLLSDFIEDPIARIDIEAALLSLPAQEIVLSSRKNNVINSTAILTVMDVSNKEVKRPELYPIQGGSISRGLIKFIKSKGYYRIQSMVDRNNEYYLDSSGNYSVFKNDNSQLWQVCVPENNASDFMLKNVGTGLYLSSYDLKFYEKPQVEKEPNFCWHIGYSNVYGNDF